MEPRKQEQELEQTQQPRPDEKMRRFRLVKLEDRIAPKGCSSDGSGFFNCGGGCGTYMTCVPGHCK